MEENKCKTCSMGTDGHRCVDCDEEMTEQDAQSHACGPDRCMPKCAECGEADINCSCPPTVTEDDTTPASEIM